MITGEHNNAENRPEEREDAIVVSAAVYSVHVDRDGEARIAFTVPQEDAAKVGVLAVMTQELLKITIEKQKT